MSSKHLLAFSIFLPGVPFLLVICLFFVVTEEIFSCTLSSSYSDSKYSIFSPELSL